GVAAALGPAGFANPAAARELNRSQKRVLVIFLAGGGSQLETWDPKPGTATGGPFDTIATSVPGTHIFRLLPPTPNQIHPIGLVRGLNSAVRDHGIGKQIMLTGRKPEAGIEYPHLGAVAAKLLGSGGDALPGHIHVFPARGADGGSRPDAAFLGAQFASVPV